LTPDVIAAEAETLADEVGLSALTLAALAERLGVRVPSLYKHVAGLDGVHRLIEARAKTELGDTLADAALGVSGTDAVTAVAAAYRAWAKAHPGRYEATLVAPHPDDAASTEASERAVRVVEATLTGYGLTGDDAVDAVRTVRAALHGFVALEAAGGFGLPRDVDRSFERLVAALIRSLEAWVN
jgi:AcrR family transcriptional regulator